MEDTMSVVLTSRGNELTTGAVCLAAGGDSRRESDQIRKVELKTYFSTDGGETFIGAETTF
jgi:hypothetical protein